MRIAKRFAQLLAQVTDAQNYFGGMTIAHAI
jgi:hypothetical protein